MSTPKPGQIRCPTCLRSTPPAAFCTQCGSPIPPSARVRPRGLDRDELEERVRRRPGEGPFRRGSQADLSPESAGYVPFTPEPEDSLALRAEDESPVYSGPHPDEGSSSAPPPRPMPPAAARPDVRPVPAPPVPPASSMAPTAPPPASEPHAPEPPASAQPPASEQPAGDYLDDGYDDRPYGEPEDAYAYPYMTEERGGGGGGGGALPIIGFIVLSVLALAVGAVLAGLLGGDGGVGQQTPSPSIASVEPSVAPTLEPTPVPSEDGASATPEPTDGPVAFPDGAQLSVQPCATNGFRDAAVGKPELDACEVDGSSVDNGEVWVFIVFRSTGGEDNLRVRLLFNGEPQDEQELRVGEILSNCGATCSGLVYGRHYVDLLPGDYELVLRRNGSFADRASFSVDG